MKRMLYRINSKFFCAGFITDNTGKCVNAAPILRKSCLGKTIDEIKKVYYRIGNTIDLVDDDFKTKDMAKLDLFFTKK